MGLIAWWKFFHNISANIPVNIAADLKANLTTAGNDKRVVGKVASVAGFGRAST
ncbi:hypothetical protein CAter282_4221 [Collimonas arenae]|uniref:Uncharacterized protein n=1 Tax=Collimonas arenae TaxID=279058 RepID=A0A127QPA9_9BURK|nr:hypothetical protein CAter10_4595 [Collimonas arenae]AMP11881.1 hypothetical protein CAter282_4221 [Collimonas arenae]